MANENSNKYLSLDNLKLIWRMIANTFARKDYANYLEKRITSLENMSSTEDILDLFAGLKLNIDNILDNIDNYTESQSIINTNLVNAINGLEARIVAIEEKLNKLNVKAG